MPVRIDAILPGKNANGFTKLRVQFQYYDLTDPANPKRLGKPMGETFDEIAMDTPEKVQAAIDTITPIMEFNAGITSPNVDHMKSFMVGPIKQGDVPIAPAAPGKAASSLQS